MNHWQMIAFAYALTGAALAVETALLFRRRRNALRQARAWTEDQDATGSGAGIPGGSAPAGAKAAS